MCCSDTNLESDSRAYILNLFSLVPSSSVVKFFGSRGLDYISCYSSCSDLPVVGAYYIFRFAWASLVAQLVKNLPAMQETWAQSLGWEDPLKKGKAAHSSILAWKIPWTVYTLGLQRVGRDWMTFTFTLNTWWVGSMKWASLVAQLVKDPPAMQETLVWFLGQEDPMEKG